MNHPLLIIHGEDDRIINVSHGKKLFEASPATDKELRVIPDAGHNDLFIVAFDEVANLLESFAKRAGQ